MTHSLRRALVSAKVSFTPPDSQESPSEPDVPPQPQAKPFSETPDSLSMRFANDYSSSPPPFQGSPLPLPSTSSGYPPSPPSGTAPITPFIAVPFSVFLAFLLLNAFILACIRRKADALDSTTADETGEEGSLDGAAAAETRSPTAAAAAAAAAASWFGSFSPRGSGQRRSQGWRPADNRGLDRALIDALPCHVFREGRQAEVCGGSLGKDEAAPTRPSCDAPVDPTGLEKEPAVLAKNNEGEACSEVGRETKGGEPTLAKGNLCSPPVFSEEVEMSQDPNRLLCRAVTSEPVHCAADVLRECPVCLCEYEDGDIVKTIPKCSHGFHVECIDAWLQRKTTCPLCRVELRPEEQKLHLGEEGDVSNGADQQDMQPAQGHSHGSETSSDDSEEGDLLPSMQSPTQVPMEDNMAHPPPLQQ